jgi:hypothetical protein
MQAEIRKLLDETNVFMKSRRRKEIGIEAMMMCA